MFGMDGNTQHPSLLGLDIEGAALTAWEDANALLNLSDRAWLLGAPDCYGEFLYWAKRVRLIGDCIPTQPYDLEPEAHAAWEVWRNTRCWVA